MLQLLNNYEFELASKINTHEQEQRETKNVFKITKYE